MPDTLPPTAADEPPAPAADAAPDAGVTPPSPDVAADAAPAAAATPAPDDDGTGLAPQADAHEAGAQEPDAHEAGAPETDPHEAAASPAPGPAPAPVAAPLPPAECAQQLKQRFPALFSGAVKPLKLRIQVDIQQRAPGVFSKQTLAAFFRRHTGSTSYLLAVAKAPHRVDLDGQPSGEVAPEHRQAALDELARRRGNQDARRELEEQQRRNRAGLLHDYQTTTLTRANFCVLKGVAEPELDGLLEIAREEAEERARHAPPPHRPMPSRGPQGARPQEAERPRQNAGPGGRPGPRRPR